MSAQRGDQRLDAVAEQGGALGVDVGGQAGLVGAHRQALVLFPGVLGLGAVRGGLVDDGRHIGGIDMEHRAVQRGPDHGGVQLGLGDQRGRGELIAVDLADVRVGGAHADHADGADDGEQCAKQHKGGVESEADGKSVQHGSRGGLGRSDLYRRADPVSEAGPAAAARLASARRLEVLSTAPPCHFRCVPGHPRAGRWGCSA